MFRRLYNKLFRRPVAGFSYQHDRTTFNGILANSTGNLIIYARRDPLPGTRDIRPVEAYVTVQREHIEMLRQWFINYDAREGISYVDNEAVLGNGTLPLQQGTRRSDRGPTGT
jgi:hypothetical protein